MTALVLQFESHVLNSEFRPEELQSLKMIQTADKNLCMSIAEQNIPTLNKPNKAQFAPNYSLGRENSCTCHTTDWLCQVCHNIFNW